MHMGCTQTSDCSYVSRFTFYVSVVQPRTDAGAMHGGMAPCGPAGALLHELIVGNLADDERARAGAGRLGVALEAEIEVALDEQFRVNGTVRGVATRAAFPERAVFVNLGLGLLAMAFGARFVHPRHAEAQAGRFENVTAVRVMTLDAVHPAFGHGMVLGEIELGVRLEVAIVAGLGILAGIDDELAPATARGDVFAAGPVTGFTAGVTALRAFPMDPSVGAGGEGAAVVGVTFGARSVAREGCAFDGGRRDHRALERRTRHEHHRRREQDKSEHSGDAGMD